MLLRFDATPSLFALHHDFPLTGPDVFYLCGDRRSQFLVPNDFAALIRDGRTRQPLNQVRRRRRQKKARGGGDRQSFSLHCIVRDSRMRAISGVMLLFGGGGGGKSKLLFHLVNVFGGDVVVVVESP